MMSETAEQHPDVPPRADPGGRPPPRGRKVAQATRLRDCEPGLRSVDRFHPDARNCQAREGLVGRGHRPANIDTAASLLDYHRLKTATMRILRRVAHANVQRQADEENPLETALAQISGKPGRRRVVVLVEYGIGID